MSRIGELILKTLVRIRTERRPAHRDELQGEMWEPYIQWQFESSARLFAKYPGFEVAGKTVLEIGCGTGGRSAYLASQGACCVVGIDINDAEIQIARQLCPALYPETSDRLRFLTSAEDGRLDIGVFDIVVIVDCMEHVVSPALMLRLAYEYTRPGGKCFFSNIGWYHYLGSHTGLLPFVNVFFSDETILNVMRWFVSRPEYVPSRFDSDPPVARWRGLYDLKDRPGERLNKLTIHEVKKLLRYSPFLKTKLSVVGFGGRHPVFRLFDPLRYIPLIQEVCHSLIVVECER